MKGSKWRHWKEGRLYLVLGVALHSETREELVIYQRAGDAAGQLWVRPLAMWNDEARPGVRRFTAFVEGGPPPTSRCYKCGAPATTRAWVEDRHTGSKRRVVSTCAGCAGSDETTLPTGTLEGTTS